MWQATADYNGRLACFNFKKAQSAEGKRALKAVRVLCGLISRPDLDICLLYHHKTQEGGCKEIQIKLAKAFDTLEIMRPEHSKDR